MPGWFRRRNTRVSDDDRLVELVTVGFVEAELLAARLRDAGIKCATFSTGTSGSQPALAWSEGTRIMVREADYELATQVVREQIS